jgi:hypothetical protein
MPAAAAPHPGANLAPELKPIGGATGDYNGLSERWDRGEPETYPTGI